jgi:uncharacterized repeat protein (TIGR02543 family)
MAMVLCSAVSLLVTGSAAIGQAAQGGSVSGTVTDEPTGDPLEGICVFVYAADFNRAASTDASGTFTVNEVPPGDHKVGFFDECDGSTEYLSEFYNDKLDLASADPVAVAEGQTTLGIDAALNRPGSISGTITDELTGAPLEGMCVDGRDPTTGQSASYAQTGPGGIYTLGGLRTGNYIVSFSGCSPESAYFQEFYNDRPDEFSADLVPVTVGEDTREIDAALTPGGFILGTVTDEATGERLFGICVYVFDSQNRQADVEITSGVYFVGPLRAGEYYVAFTDTCEDEEPQMSDYVSEWYDNAPTRATATAITVTPGQQTTGIDAALTFGGSISGLVTDEASGQPLPVICVILYDAATGAYMTDTFTVSDGTYAIGALRTGNYVVRFSDGCDEGATYPDEFFDDRPNIESADPVAVTVGESTGGIDAALARPLLTVLKPGKGSGSVSSVPEGIDCGPSCQSNFDWLATVELTATASPGSTFKGWTGGGCSREPVCIVTMEQDVTVTATFKKRSKH